MMNYKKYKRVPVVDFPRREWPNKEIKKAPVSKVQALPAHRPGGPHLAGEDPHPGAGVVQRGFARRQPGSD